MRTFRANLQNMNVEQGIAVFAIERLLSSNPPRVATPALVDEKTTVDRSLSNSALSPSHSAVTALANCGKRRAAGHAGYRERYTSRNRKS